MDSSPSPVAGSYQRNDLHILHGQEEVKSQNGKVSDVKVCRVCGEEIGVKENGELFIACHECGFPVCNPCYEYEQSQGNQCCPQCNTRYKRRKGCPRVDGDKDEASDLEDFEDEFPIKSPKPAFDLNSCILQENGEEMQNWRPGGPAFSSFTGIVAGKDLENGREMESNLEWKERVDKWKARQEKKGLMSKEGQGNDNEDNDEDYEL